MEILGRHCCSNLIPCVKDCIQEVLFAVQDIRPKKVWRWRTPGVLQTSAHVQLHGQVGEVPEPSPQVQKLECSMGDLDHLFSTAQLVTMHAQLMLGLQRI